VKDTYNHKSWDQIIDFFIQTNIIYITKYTSNKAIIGSKDFSKSRIGLNWLSAKKYVQLKLTKTLLKRIQLTTKLEM